MTAAITAGGPAAVPSASWLKFVILGNSGVDEYGFRGPPNGGTFGAIQVTNRIGNRVVSQFAYDWDDVEFTFEVDETNPGGFSFTRLLVEDFTGNFITLLRSAAVEYSGFPLHGWIWTSIPGGGPLWTLASVGTEKRIYVQR